MTKSSMSECYIFFTLLYRSFSRLCESDMLVEIAGISMIGAMLEDAAKVLTNSGNSVR